MSCYQRWSAVVILLIRTYGTGISFLISIKLTGLFIYKPDYESSGLKIRHKMLMCELTDIYKEKLVRRSGPGEDKLSE